MGLQLLNLATHTEKGSVPENPVEEIHLNVGNAKEGVSWITGKLWMQSCGMDTAALPSPSLPWLYLQHQLHLPKYELLTERAMADLMIL